jgi:aminobenzoyl-glutamate utilization protein B
MKRILSIALLTLTIFASLATAQDEMKQAAFSIIDDHAASLTKLSDAIWENAEIALEETKSAELLASALEAAGFKVTRNVAGLETAFIAEWGNDGPRIGILAEYDALPGISQKCGSTTKEAHLKGGAGHGCGHNIFGVACLGTVLALKDVMTENKIPGTIVFYGCPAEETVVGKVVMAKAGLFDDLDAALTWHPSTRSGVSLDGSLANNNFEVTFHGKAAHGAADPWNGRSALDALEMFHYGINMLREHVKPTVRMHYVVKDGGGVPNVVPETATGWYFVRDETRDGVRSVYNRVLKIAEGAALATETTFDVNLITGVHSELVNMVIAKATYANMQLVGVPEWDDADQALVKGLQKTLGVEQTGLRSQLEPFAKHNGSKGSTDVAEVSRIAPLAEFGFAMAPDNGPWHSWVVVSTTGASPGRKAMIAAAKVMAATSLDLFTDAELLAAAKAEFVKSMEGNPYVSPLEER